MKRPSCRGPFNINKMTDEIKKFQDSPIYFLGICDKFNEPVIFRPGPYELKRTDLIGLRRAFLCHIFPIFSLDLYLVCLLDNNFISDESGLTLIVKYSKNSEEVGFISVKAQVLGEGNRFHSRFTLFAEKISESLFFPGTYEVLLKSDATETLLGEFELIHIPALPLTEERIRALKSDPKAIKYIKYGVSCKKCGDSIKAFVGINGRENEKDGYVWYEDLPSKFICSCGEANFSLMYVKENLHGLLGYKESPFSVEEDIERNYTRAALKRIVDDFWQIIDKETVEQEIQKFIEQNPIILSCFSPALLKPKAPATAKYKTDFAILNQKGELILIEIEKTNTPLFTKAGVQHSRLTQAIDQVENWLQEARRNKLGLIDDLSMEGLKLDMVTAIKGVVVAGRSLEEYKPHIEKLHARSDISFYTYDDLYKFLRNVVSRVEEV